MFACLYMIFIIIFFFFWFIIVELMFLLFLHNFYRHLLVCISSLLFFFFFFFWVFIHHLAFLFLVHRKAFSIFFSHWWRWFFLLIHDDNVQGWLCAFSTLHTFHEFYLSFMWVHLFLYVLTMAIFPSHATLSSSFLHLHPHIVFFFSHLLLFCICIPM